MKTKDFDHANNQSNRISPAMRDMLARYRKSKLTQRDFAKQSGIGLSTLQRYLRFQRDPNFHGYSHPKAQPKSKHQPKPRLLELALPSVPPYGDNAPWQWQLRLPNGTVLQCRDWPQRQQLQSFLQALGETC
jgi:hypothetical protein